MCVNMNHKWMKTRQILSIKHKIFSFTRNLFVCVWQPYFVLLNLHLKAVCANAGPKCALCITMIDTRDSVCDWWRRYMWHSQSVCCVHPITEGQTIWNIMYCIFWYENKCLYVICHILWCAKWMLYVLWNMLWCTKWMLYVLWNMLWCAKCMFVCTMKNALVCCHKLANTIGQTL